MKAVVGLIFSVLVLASTLAQTAQAQTRQCTSTRVGNTVYTTCY